MNVLSKRNKINGLTGFALSIILSCCTYSSRSDLPLVLPETVSFQGHILPIFNAHCSIPSCHSHQDQEANLDLSPDSAYAYLMDKDEIDLSNPAWSILYVQLNSTSNPMPPTGKLSDYDIALVLKWIEQGALNN